MATPSNRPVASAQATKKKKNRTAIILVVLLVGAPVCVSVCGILAAIAIPAFLRSVKKTKATEAEMTVRKMVDGAKSYYSFEQRQAPNQPWHTTGDGVPIPAEQYTFPGGTNYRLVSSSRIPTGGSKVEVAPEAPRHLEPTLQTLIEPFSTMSASYFRYTYETGPGRGKDATATIRAEADFQPGGARHIMEQQLSVDATGEIMVTPPFITNEFE